MDFANRGGRFTAQTPKKSFEPEMPQQHKNSGKGMDIGKLGGILMVIGVAALLTVVVGALVFGGKYSYRSESKLIETDKYQAVFLESTDGQVYFGKLSVYNSSLYVLKDIYYLRVEQPIQPEGEQTKNNVSLAKLGKELHGPEDYMYISRDKVLFWENLTDEGQVVKAIKQYQENGPQDTSTSNSTTTDTTATEEETTNP